MKGEAENFSVMLIAAILTIPIIGLAIFGQGTINGPSEFNAQTLAANIASTMSELQFLERATKLYVVKGHMELELTSSQVIARPTRCLGGCEVAKYDHAINPSRIQTSGKIPIGEGTRTIVCLEKKEKLSVSTCIWNNDRDCRGFCDVYG